MEGIDLTRDGLITNTSSEHIFCFDKNYKKSTFFPLSEVYRKKRYQVFDYPGLPGYIDPHDLYCGIGRTGVFDYIYEWGRVDKCDRCGKEKQGWDSMRDLCYDCLQVKNSNIFNSPFNIISNALRRI